MNNGWSFWERAKKVIPGGNMLLSKRPEMFLPESWPSYYSRASGCKIWDLDGLEYTDFSIMGIGTNTLGYGHPEVDAAVSLAMQNGNMSTFNCFEEVQLAEKLIDMHPWSDMVRFARTGGEANAIAIRIARAAAGKSRVAFCGYHGWHDWYLAANLSEDGNLDGHLMPGLSTGGVPRELSDSVLPFEYNRIDQLDALLQNYEIGVIMMEVSRNFGPENGFLEKVRERATKKGCVLIFDECTSGFRETFGGLHLKYGVNPDVAVFGKALGNGYAITAVLGKQEVMEAAHNTFISSTFWTERIGPAAALKTIEVMEKIRSWELISESGDYLAKKWCEIAARNNLNIQVSGLRSIQSFSIKSVIDEPNRSAKLKTFITQEMLKKGYLATPLVFSCVNHTKDLIDSYSDGLNDIFLKINKSELGSLKLDELLDGPVCHTGFKRLN